MVAVAGQGGSLGIVEIGAAFGHGHVLEAEVALGIVAVHGEREAVGAGQGNVVAYA